MSGISSRALGAGGIDAGCGCPNKKGFNGNEKQEREFGDGSGFDVYDFNARTYDQQIGRFIQIDPLLEEGSQEMISPYHFAYNNPIRFKDPDGKCPLCPAIPYIIEGIEIAWSAYRAYKTAETVVTALDQANQMNVANSSRTVTSMVIVIDAKGNPIAITEDQSKKLGLKPGQVVKNESQENKEKHGGGKNAQHANQKARDAAKEKYETAKKELDQLKSKPNKTKEDKEQIQKMDNTGENHSRKAKGS
jgi:RHS repeat-associated protein